MAEYDTLDFTMEINLTVEEAKSLDQAYHEGLTAKGYPVYSTDAPDHPTIGKPGYPTREEAAEYSDTLLYLNSIIENIHVASVQQNMYPSFSVWEDTPQPVPITVQQWRTLREALAIRFCYNVYMEKYTAAHPDVDENSIYRETERFIASALGNESWRTTTQDPTSIPIASAQWRTLWEVLSTVFSTHRINPSLTGPATAYRTLLQKLNTYELAAHVEEALTTETAILHPAGGTT